MQPVETYRWRILWGGKWRTTGHHWTEAEIRAEHPEAVRVEGSRQVRTEGQRPAPGSTVYVTVGLTKLGHS